MTSTISLLFPLEGPLSYVTRQSEYTTCEEKSTITTTTITEPERHTRPPISTCAVRKKLNGSGSPSNAIKRWATNHLEANILNVAETADGGTTLRLPTERRHHDRGQQIASLTSICGSGEPLCWPPLMVVSENNVCVAWNTRDSVVFFVCANVRL